MERDLLDGHAFAKGTIMDELAVFAAQGGSRVEFTVLSHGAGTQTSVLLSLASGSYHLAPGTPGHLNVDWAMFADVGDSGTPCEWPETLTFLRRLHFVSWVPIVRLEPYMWNEWLKNDDSGLYDRYLRRETMPFRMYRSCTDWFKVRPQVAYMAYIHNEAAALGIDVRFRQIIGYSADEESRAARFVPDLPYITPWFPLVEWGWRRDETVGHYQRLLPQIAHTIGLPERSGCWFCPFQKRGKFDPLTLEPEPRSWLALYEQEPKLFEMAVKMERVQNERRVAEGKKPAYLHGTRPLTAYIAPERTAITMAFEFYDDVEDAGRDDTCTGWGCFI